MSPPEQPLTVAEFSAWLKVSPTAVYDACRTGKLPHLRIGLGRGTIRIDKQKALAALEQEGRKSIADKDPSLSSLKRRLAAV